PDDGEEAFDQRGAFFRPDLGKLDLHTAECTKPSPGQLRQIPGLLRSYSIPTSSGCLDLSIRAG
ncbi:MAG TPA: hypothetical protein VFA18_21480, partial [Gemmataceae bacterium]|nr:hypothetical protein [Gemmataceae bacterium]